MKEKRLDRNPAHLLSLRDDPTLLRLLRAAGAPEACITGGASDCDRFLSLAEAMPRLEGHPIKESMQRTLTAATGLAAPLCPHTARAHWEAFAQRYWYADIPAEETAVAQSTPPALCPCCPPCEPRRLSRRMLSLLPDPLKMPADSLTLWSEALEHALTDGPAHAAALIQIPSSYTFVRPDPYHAGLILQRAYEGKELTVREQGLLLTQALRVWGLAATRDGSSLLLRGGASAEITALLTYLHTANALPALIWIPDDPADAGTVSGLYPAVRTGFDPSAAPDAASRYAAVAPIGTAVVLTENEKKDKES